MSVSAFEVADICYKVQVQICTGPRTPFFYYMWSNITKKEKKKTINKLPSVSCIAGWSNLYCPSLLYLV